MRCLLFLLLLEGCAPSSSATIGAIREDAVCTRPSSVEGVDVSYYQGAIDWTKVESSGIDFGFVRISDGLSHPDSQFELNWAGARDAGLLRGAYQYFEPGEDAVAQADLVVERVGELGPGDLPVALDVEALGGALPDAAPSAVKDWIARVAAGTGKPPLVYTAPNFWDEYFGTLELADCPLWVADYGVACPTLPSGFGAWLFWQTGYRDDIGGVTGDVDVDVFNGSVEELRAFAGLRDAGTALGHARRGETQRSRRAAADASDVAFLDAAAVRVAEPDAARDAALLEPKIPTGDAAARGTVHSERRGGCATTAGDLNGNGGVWALFTALLCASWRRDRERTQGEVEGWKPRRRVSNVSSQRRGSRISTAPCPKSALPRWCPSRLRPLNVHAGSPR